MGTSVVIVGGGVGGLASAIALGRAGHRVTVLERDPLPATADVEAAFATERRGAPQSHQTHGFLARVVVELREHLPDVLERLLAAGCTTMPGRGDLGEPRPGDEDLKVLIVRRTTFEWVLRQVALEEPNVEIRGGVGVAGLVAGEPVPGESGLGAPVVTGVRLEDGSVVDADMVVAATGRRGPVDTWLAEIGVDVREEVHQSGLMYLSRWYRVPGGISAELDPKLGGDLGFVKYLAVPGDGDTLSVTLAIKTDDPELRRTLSDEERFEAACHMLPGPDQFFGKLDLVPVGGVRPMGGLINRVRHFTDESGAPTVLGFHAVGDAHTCTNPLYGRGCALALVEALRLADAAAANPDDAAGRARTYEATCLEEVRPWYEVSLQMDKAGADPTAGGLAGGLTGGGDEGKGLAALFAAALTDPIVGRGIGKFMNLLATPTQLMADAELLGRIAEIMADPDSVPLPPVEGPKRSELLAALVGIGADRDDTAADELAGELEIEGVA